MAYVFFTQMKFCVTRYFQSYYFSLMTLEASITDQSSLSKLLQIRDNKIQDLERQIDEKDESIVNLENKYKLLCLN